MTDRGVPRRSGDVRAVYYKHKDSGMRLVETAGDTAVIVSPYSPRADGFLQIEIGPEKKMAASFSATGSRMRTAGPLAPVGVRGGAP
jgi:hypothetical protein